MEKLTSSVNLTNALVVTGSIASGKSSVCKILKDLGYDIIDADAIAHQVLQDLHVEIEAGFGQKFVHEGRVNRVELGKLVFQDTQAIQRLEALTHPKINNQIIVEAKVLELKKRLYFMNVPLFFEVQRNYTVAAVIVVYCKKEIALERLMRRNNLNLLEAEQRMCRQWDIERKKEGADFIVDNSTDEKNLPREAQRLINRLSKHFHHV